VNLAAVKKLVIGVGDRASPKPAAAPPAASRNSRREVRRFIQSRNVIKKATTSSICSALKTGLPR